MSRRAGDIFLVLAAAGVFLVSCWLQSRIVEPRRTEFLKLKSALPRALLHAAAYSSARSAGDRPWFVPGERRVDLSDLPSRAAAIGLGGLRGFLSIYLWVGAESEKSQRLHEDLLDRYHRIVNLQPDYPAVYEFHAWNLAWNLSVQWATAERRYEWVRHGLDLLAEGIRRNPQSVELPAAMGRIYFEKIERNMTPGDREYFTRRVEEDDGATPLFMAYKWYDRARRVQEETGQPHPLFSRKTLHQQACYVSHEYAKETLRKALATLGEADDLQAKGQAAEAAEKAAEGDRQLQYAAQWWAAAANEWARQRERFPDDFNALQFGGGAAVGHGIVLRLIAQLTPQALARDPKSFHVLLGSARTEYLLVRRTYYQEEPPEAYAQP